MATSNAQRVKAAIIGALADAPGLSGVQVAYSLPRSPEREVVYGGGIDVDQKIGTGRSSEGNTTRDEDASIDLHVRVQLPGEDCEAVEARALELGEAVESHLALTTPDVLGLLDASVSGYELVSGVDDDSAIAVLTYHIQTTSYIT